MKNTILKSLLYVNFIYTIFLCTAKPSEIKIFLRGKYNEEKYELLKITINNDFGILVRNYDCLPKEQTLFDFFALTGNYRAVEIIIDFINKKIQNHDIYSPVYFAYITPIQSYQNGPGRYHFSKMFFEIVNRKDKVGLNDLLPHLKVLQLLETSAPTKREYLHFHYHLWDFIIFAGGRSGRLSRQEEYAKLAPTGDYFQRCDYMQQPELVNKVWRNLEDPDFGNAVWEFFIEHDPATKAIATLSPSVLFENDLRLELPLDKVPMNALFRIIGKRTDNLSSLLTGNYNLSVQIERKEKYIKIFNRFRSHFSQNDHPLFKYLHRRIINQDGTSQSFFLELLRSGLRLNKQDLERDPVRFPYETPAGFKNMFTHVNSHDTEIALWLMIYGVKGKDFRFFSLKTLYNDIYLKAMDEIDEALAHYKNFEQTFLPITSRLTGFLYPHMANDVAKIIVGKLNREPDLRSLTQTCKMANTAITPMLNNKETLSAQENALRVLLKDRSIKDEYYIKYLLSLNKLPLLQALLNQL